MKNAILKKMLIYFIFAVLLTFVIFLFSYFIGCPIRLLTGVPCPACGITRAYISLLNGEFSLAFHYHPLFLLLPFAIALAFLLIHYEKKKPNDKLQLLLIIIALIILFIFISFYIYRLLNGLIP